MSYAINSCIPNVSLCLFSMFFQSSILTPRFYSFPVISYIHVLCIPTFQIRPSVCFKDSIIMMHLVSLLFKTATKLGLEFNRMVHRYLAPQIKCAIILSLKKKIGLFISIKICLTFRVSAFSFC